MGDIAVTDIVVLIIALLSILLGFSRGLSKEVLSLMGWVGASLITVFLFPYVEPHVYAWVGNKWLSRIISGAGLFIIAMVILMTLSNFVSKKIQNSFMGGLDRSFGALFGIVRAWVITAIIYIAISIFYEKYEYIPADIRGAKSTPVITLGADFVWSLLPARLQSNVGDAAKSVTGKTEIDILNKGVDGLGGSNSNHKIFEKLINPRPFGERQKTLDGYNEKERKKLDELMERSVR